MAELRLSKRAAKDLEDIWRVGRDEFGADVASDYLRKFNDAFALLATHPRAGQALTGFNLPYRCFQQQRHRLYYLLDADRIEIVRILHAARNARSVLSRS